MKPLGTVSDISYLLAIVIVFFFFVYMSLSATLFVLCSLKFHTKLEIDAVFVEIKHVSIVMFCKSN